jgi:hypothetical protein
MPLRLIRGGVKFWSRNDDEFLNAVQWSLFSAYRLGECVLTWVAEVAKNPLHASHNAQDAAAATSERKNFGTGSRLVAIRTPPKFCPP